MTMSQTSPHRRRHSCLRLTPGFAITLAEASLGAGSEPTLPACTCVLRVAGLLVLLGLPCLLGLRFGPLFLEGAVASRHSSPAAAAPASGPTCPPRL